MEISEEYKAFHVSTVYFRAGQVRARRVASIGPGATYSNTEASHDDWEDRPLASPSRHSQETTTSTHLAHGIISMGGRQRRLSVDNFFFQRTPLSYEELSIVPTPPYSPSATQHSSPLRPVSLDSLPNHPPQPVRDFSEPDLSRG